MEEFFHFDKMMDFPTFIRKTEIEEEERKLKKLKE